MTVELKKMKAIVQKEYGYAPEDVLRISHVAQPRPADGQPLHRFVGEVGHLFARTHACSHCDSTVPTHHGQLLDDGTYHLGLRPACA